MEEKLINGIAHWRNSADEEWKPYGLEELSQRYFEALRLGGIEAQSLSPMDDAMNSEEPEERQ